MSPCNRVGANCKCERIEHPLTDAHRCSCGGEWLHVPEDSERLIPVVLPTGHEVPLNIVRVGIAGTSLEPLFIALYHELNPN